MNLLNPGQLAKVQRQNSVFEVSIVDMFVGDVPNPNRQAVGEFNWPAMQPYRDSLKLSPSKDQ